MTSYPFKLDDFLDEYDLTKEQFAEIIGKDLKAVWKIEVRKGLNTHEHSALCRVFGKESVADFYDTSRSMRNMQ